MVLLSFQYHLVRHILDIMHCEKNFAENIMKTLLGNKDTTAIRKDLQAKGLRPHLWLQPTGPRLDRVFMPDVPFILLKEDKVEFFQTLRSIKFPNDYVSNLHKKISRGKLSSLKSHDHHVLLQQVLPLLLRNIGDQRVVGVIVHVSRIFQWLCSKVTDPDSREELLDDVAVTLATLEKEFPPAFFDIKVHLPRYLAEELFICGLTHARWMYLFERYMKTLKGHVRNLARLEGSMA
jgi:hypothetical protein